MVRLLLVDDKPGTLTAADGDPPAVLPPEAGSRFHALILIEGQETDDGRIVEQGATVWNTPIEPGSIPLMGVDRTTMGHDESIVIGHFDTIERIGDEIHGWGPWDTTPETLAIRLKVLDGHMRGVSVDPGEYEWELLITPEMQEADREMEEYWQSVMDAIDSGEDPPEQPTDDEGNIVIAQPEPKQRITHLGVRGATVLPVAAFAGTFIEDDTVTSEGQAAIAASVGVTGLLVSLDHAATLTAAAVKIRPPIAPPRDWLFSTADGPTPLTITDEGQVFGHGLLWDTCHMGYPDACVMAPRSRNGYAYFHTGEIATDDGERHPVGHITLKGGHAHDHLGHAAAKAYYDDTRSVFADVRATEDEWGLWLAGSLRSNISASDVRAAMASAPSGDWREVGGNLELIQFSAVNVPGFPVPRVKAYVREDGMVASLIASIPVTARDRAQARMENSHATTRDDRYRRKLADLIAISVGRDRESRRREAWAKVHG